MITPTPPTPLPAALRIGSEVADALADGRPVVALESTIIAHGMPWPTNLETARAVEAIVRDAGAVPATVAVLGGVMRVGLDDADLEELATRTDVRKASRRDLGVVVAEGGHAATTVSATMIGAAMAGIRLFATGGTGGVHRGGEHSLDVSADLTELQRTPVAVVSAGVKSILDIARTLEYLETLGVPVITLGADEFPAFYSRTSGHASPLRLDDPTSVARALVAHWRLPGSGGALIANPIPAESEIAYRDIATAIDRAVTEADERQIAGRDVTPYLLRRIVELTGGRSLEANIALVKHNARIAAEIAAAVEALHRTDGA